MWLRIRAKPQCGGRRENSPLAHVGEFAALELPRLVRCNSTWRIAGQPVRWSTIDAGAAGGHGAALVGAKPGVGSARCCPFRGRCYETARRVRRSLSRLARPDRERESVDNAFLPVESKREREPGPHRTPLGEIYARIQSAARPWHGPAMNLVSCGEPSMKISGAANRWITRPSPRPSSCSIGS